MNYLTAIAWIRDAIVDLIPLVEAELPEKEKTLVEAIKAAFAAYEA